VAGTDCQSEVAIQGFPNTPCWRTAPNSISAPTVHVIRDGSLEGCQSLSRRRRWSHLTKSGGSYLSARCGAGAACSGSIGRDHSRFPRFPALLQPSSGPLQVRQRLHTNKVEVMSWVNRGSTALVARIGNFGSPNNRCVCGLDFYA
jgi:hypothetical protein